MDELLDLVNEKDEVIGEVWRSEANSDPKMTHREVLVFVFDDNNRLLMQQRSFNKKIYPGYWTETSAGHVEKGEDPEVTAHRELKEELGFDLPLRYVAKKYVSAANETHFSYCYIGQYSGEKINFQKEEVNDVKFVEKDKIDELFDKNDDKVTIDEYDWIKKIWEEK